MADPLAAPPRRIKRAQQLAESIERRILDERLAEGEHLGNEAALLQRYDVSRSVLREALVLVARSGLARMQRGKNGGLIVTAGSPDMITVGLQNYISCLAGDFDDVRAARRELEDLALALAIDRFQPGDLASVRLLDARYQAAADPYQRLALGAEMLAAVVACARNPFLSVLVTAFAGAAVERLALVRGSGGRLLQMADRVPTLRHIQLRALLAADRGRAIAANAELHALYAEMHAVPEQIDEPTAGAVGTTLLRSATGLGLPRRLADEIAGRLRGRIAREGLAQTGGRIGSEVALMAHYRVSRGVLREAIRILERMALVYTIRGKQGGLYAAPPDAAAIVQSTSLHLRSLNIRHRHIQETGEALGLIAVERAARRVSAYDGPTLAALLAPLGTIRDTTLRSLAFAHYDVIGRLSGSPAITLAMSIAGNLFALDEAPEADQLIVREIVPERLRDLLDAILVGDADLARRRMIMLQRSGARVRARSFAEITSPRVLHSAEPPKPI